MAARTFTFYAVIIRQEEQNYCDFGEITARITDSPTQYKVGESLSDGVSSQGIVKAIIPVEWREHF